MEISDITIKRIVEQKGHIGFVSCVIGGELKLNNIAIFKRLNKEGYRLVFPEKKVLDKTIQLFFPLSKDFYYKLEKSISEKI